jgi:hypothetical protein
MSQKTRHLSGGPNLRLVILALSILVLGLTGCSEDQPTQASPGGNDPVTGVFQVDMGNDDADFEIISMKNGDPEDPIDGPFAIVGRNIRYDAELNALVVDLSVKNLGENTFDEDVMLTFLSLLPEGVRVLNPDNEENGAGAAIVFEFENDDGQWTPGEESLGRETHFGVEEGTSIGFTARLDTGIGAGLGSIGGMVWNDENGDGIMDEGEAGVEGAMLELSAELADGAHPYWTTPEHTATARSIIGPDKLLCVEQKVVLSTDPDIARAAAVGALGMYVDLPNYRNNWKRLGFSEEEIEARADRFVDGVVAWGDIDAIKARIGEHYEAGATQVCVQPVNTELGNTTPDWDLLEALAPS